jgi:phenylalanyl-tRNA synthetase beta subunit
MIEPNRFERGFDAYALESAIRMTTDLIKQTEDGTFIDVTLRGHMQKLLTLQVKLLCRASGLNTDNDVMPFDG